MPPTQEFQFFPNLPIELRLKIWRIALCIPRIVPITCEKGVNKGEAPTRFAKAFRSHIPPPPLLHTNHESRDFALSYYTPYFTTPTSPNYTYCHLPYDTISCSDNITAYFKPLELSSICTMQLEVLDIAYFGHFHMDTLKKMSKLVDLELLTREGVVYAWDRGNPGRYVKSLTADFEMEKKIDPGWECPRVRILKKSTGEQLGGISGGALIPGWKSGDPYPEDW